MRPGWTEIILILVLVVILFGSAKIPGMMKNLAGGVKVFKQELKDTDSDKVAKKPVSKKVASKTAGARAKKSANAGRAKKVSEKKAK